MLGSLYSAVSGLSAHQTKMNVIGNNIANINTYGFKSSRVTFSDVFYRTLSTSSSSSSTTGGTNPTQLGYGAQVNSIDVINTRSGSATTDRALDVYINGDGYLAVQDTDGAMKYTRVGILKFDPSGNLSDSNGNLVLGLSVNSTTGKVELNSDGTTDTSNLAAISVAPSVYEKLSNIAISDDGSITATKQGDPSVSLSSGTGWITTASIPATSNYKDALTLTATTTKTKFTTASSTSSASTTLDMLGDVSVSNSSGAYTLTYTNIDGTTMTAAGVNNSGDYDFTVSNLDGTSATFTVTAASGDLPGSGNSTTLGTVTATDKTITGTTYDQSGAAVALSGTWTSPNTSITLGDITLTVNPTTLASLKDFTDTKIGSIGTGDGNTVTIGHLALVKFGNADGLSQDGEGYYVETNNSGSAVATVAGNNGTGTLVSGALEMSNVDLSKELTEMIITQRGFQANSKMITVSDEMLETLVNMKR